MSYGVCEMSKKCVIAQQAANRAGKSVTDVLCVFHRVDTVSMEEQRSAVVVCTRSIALLPETSVTHTAHRVKQNNTVPSHALHLNMLAFKMSGISSEIANFLPTSSDVAY